MRYDVIDDSKSFFLEKKEGQYPIQRYRILSFDINRPGWEYMIELTLENMVSKRTVYDAIGNKVPYYERLTLRKGNLNEKHFAKQRISTIIRRHFSSFKIKKFSNAELSYNPCAEIELDFYDQKVEKLKNKIDKDKLLLIL